MAQFEKDGKVDWGSLKFTVKNAVIYLNEVLDEGLELHPLEYQRESVRNYRQIGLGVMGWADLLIKLKIRYGSEESLKLADNIGEFIVSCALESSMELAKEFGPAPRFSGAVLDSPFLNSHVTDKLYEDIRKYGLRNLQLLTVAPTGSTSTMLGVSGGMEPIFANSYMRKTESLHGQEYWYKVYTPIVEEYMQENNIDNEADLPS